MAIDDQQEPVADNLDALQDVNLNFTFELGRTRLTLDQLTEMGEQSLVELDKMVGEPIDVLANGKLFARGEVVTVSENFGVRLTEIIRPLTQEAADDQ